MVFVFGKVTKDSRMYNYETLFFSQILLFSPKKLYFCVIYMCN